MLKYYEVNLINNKFIINRNNYSYDRYKFFKSFDNKKEVYFCTINENDKLNKKVNVYYYNNDMYFQGISIPSCIDY